MDFLLWKQVVHLSWQAINACHCPWCMQPFMPVMAREGTTSAVGMDSTHGLFSTFGNILLHIINVNHDLFQMINLLACPVGGFLLLILGQAPGRSPPHTENCEYCKFYTPARTPRSGVHPGGVIPNGGRTGEDDETILPEREKIADRLETLEQLGQWFSRHYKLTPATSFAVMMLQFESKQ
ncbi:hypothetical protein GA0116948_11523 [Chitinophaga costaii]|uniref:Uncharacterized protein n=1 Tax=Chitinophaga costaii TaxID=1335309 RepID=A0A1C4FK44_9BACT|nr:hypothetical protein GA0116948_11523 [Chitinophaga costaii]